HLAQQVAYRLRIVAPVEHRAPGGVEMHDAALDRCFFENKAFEAVVRTTGGERRFSTHHDDDQSGFYIECNKNDSYRAGRPPKSLARCPCAAKEKAGSFRTGLRFRDVNDLSGRGDGCLGYFALPAVRETFADALHFAYERSR